MTTAEKNPNDAIVGQNVKALRTVAGITQTQLANHLGLTFQQVQKYEKGFNRMGAGRLLEVAECLGCGLMELFVGTGADSLAETGQDDYRNTRQGVKLCKDMEMLSKPTQRAFASLIGSLANPE